MDPFPALADPVRRALLRRLADGGPTRVVDLHAAVEAVAGHGLSRPAVSRHLRLLSEAGLVQAEDRGRERWYAFDRAGLAPVHGLLAALEQAPVRAEALDALDLEVRRTVRDSRTTSARTAHHQEGTA